MKAKLKPEVQIALPPIAKGIDCWHILGIDPSVSRSGFADLTVQYSPTKEATVAQWGHIGSIKPIDTSDPVWARCKATAEVMSTLSGKDIDPTINNGLILSLEQPTPMNDYLVSINRILHIMLLKDTLYDVFKRVYVQHTNAATLRSLMGLVQRGDNKGENIERAYDFINRNEYPSLDSDACDAVMLAMMGRWAATLLLGDSQAVPQNILEKLCDSGTSLKGKGKRARIITNGLLHRPEYWYQYIVKEYEISLKLAREIKRPQRVTVHI